MASLAPIWAVPFIGLLLSIAILPMAAPRLWHRHHGSFALAWAAILLVPMVVAFGAHAAVGLAVHALVHEYLPFIALLASLYAIGGGIRLTRTLSGLPTSNTALLGVGALLASLIGTTGASMVLIRPLLRAIAWRREQTHAVIFFIFIVSNVGGSLTPIGDPPLFLGYLRGVGFLWTVQHMAAPMLFTTGLLLAAFWALDRRSLKREGPPPARLPHRPEFSLIEGWLNVALMLAVVAVVIASGSVSTGITVPLGPTSLRLEEVLRVVALIALAGVSVRFTSRGLRTGNEFSWAPMREVALLFLGLFLTIAPVLAMLQAGSEGPFAAALGVLVDATGQPREAAYFWITGLLSSVLDNAPTYLVFFEAAGGDPVLLQGKLAPVLMAISCGAVFMGALTYVGNAPNFMVRSIAEARGIAMPSFFAYLLWSCGFLLPVFVLVSLIWF
ncbi:MAG: putative rane protein [Rhodospirillales bacterium]|nr:putative rane protein [Rhodospirillales bacterium]